MIGSSASRGLVILVALAACKSRGARPLQPASLAPILLFNGRGASPDDVLAFEAILDSQHLLFSTVSSSQLNEMSEAQLRTYRLLIVPGGNYETMGEHLTSNAMANVHDAVGAGLNYLGVCAGAYLAGQSRHYKSLDLAPGVEFPFYRGQDPRIQKAALAIRGSSGATLDQYWEDGPELTGWGAVVARYPNGAPAVAEGTSGTGWVILVGIHPEAPAMWRQGLTFSTPPEIDHGYASMLIDAALNRTSLPHD